MGWFEIQVCYSEEFRQQPNSGHTYRLKRECFLPILDRYEIENFLTLDEPDFVLFRILVDESVLEDAKGDIQSFVESNPYFSDIRVGDWSPQDDARARISGAKQRAVGGGVFFPSGVPTGGWKIVGRGSINENWVAGPDDLERKVGEFSEFMASRRSIYKSLH